MIKIIEGDIFDTDCDIIIHQTNTKGKMGSGIAKVIREKYPEAYREYKLLCDSTNDSSCLLGEVQLIKSKDKYICNLFGQDSYGYDGKRYTDYVAFTLGFKKIVDYAVQKKLTIAIPYKIGCGLGGADWDILYNVIDSISGCYEIKTYKIK